MIVSDVFWILFIIAIIAFVVIFIRDKIRKVREIQKKREHEKAMKETLDAVSSSLAHVTIAKEVTGDVQEKKRISTMAMPTFEKRLPRDYIAFDLETTGLDPEMNDIIEIGAVRVIDGKADQYFSTFIDPVYPIPEEATRVNHITDEMVFGSPRIGEALREFISFIGDVPLLVAHNVRFDAGFLEQAAKVQHVEINYKYLDSLAVARKYYPELKDYKLGTVARHLRYNIENAHRALDDAKAVHEIIRAAEDQITRQKEAQP